MDNNETETTVANKSLSSTVAKAVIAATVSVIASALAEKGFDKVTARRSRKTTEDQQ